MSLNFKLKKSIKIPRNFVSTFSTFDAKLMLFELQLISCFLDLGILKDGMTIHILNHLSHIDFQDTKIIKIHPDTVNILKDKDMDTVKLPDTVIDQDTVMYHSVKDRSHIEDSLLQTDTDLSLTDRLSLVTMIMTLITIMVSLRRLKNDLRICWETSSTF